MKTIDVFVVTFYSDLEILKKVLQRLSESAKVCADILCRVTIVDNSYGRGTDYFQSLQEVVTDSDLNIDLHQAPGNLGFGRANNWAFDLCFKKSTQTLG